MQLDFFNMYEYLWCFGELLVLLCYFCLLFHKMCTHVIFKSWLCWLKIYLHHSLWFIQSIHRWSSRITVVHIFRVYLKEFLLIDTYACFGLGLYVWMELLKKPFYKWPYLMSYTCSGDQRDILLHVALYEHHQYITSLLMMLHLVLKKSKF